jgi:hypothetical protein
MSEMQDEALMASPDLLAVEGPNKRDIDPLTFPPTTAAASADDAASDPEL